jgi:hypothetical protein
VHDSIGATSGLAAPANRPLNLHFLCSLLVAVYAISVLSDLYSRSHYTFAIFGALDARCKAVLKYCLGQVVQSVRSASDTLSIAHSFCSPLNQMSRINRGKEKEAQAAKRTGREPQGGPNHKLRSMGARSTTRETSRSMRNTKSDPRD